MKTRTTHAIATILSAAAILVSTAAQASATGATQAEAELNDPAATPASYISYLRHSHEEGAADALKGFQQLTPTEQQKFIGYLHDPAVLKSFLDKTTGQRNGVSAYSRSASSTSSLHNGDVTIKQERTISGISAAARKPLPRGNHEAKYTTHLKLLGVKVMKLSLWVNFHSNGRDITKANYADAGKRNLTGVISISKGTPKKSLSKWGWCQGGHCSRGHNVDASVVWEGSIAFKGSNFQIDKKQWMRANVYGRVINHSLKNV
ncbi:hypothetical protein [Streptomyces sp. NPDC003006]